MSKKKLHKLEALRGFAALYVVFNHASKYTSFLNGPFFTKLFYFGQEAVMLFFILSGFVIQYSYSISPDKSFKTFFFKRLNRIFIPLVIVLALNVFIFYIENKEIIIDTWQLAGNLLMLQDYPRVPRIIVTPFLENNPLWSLSYEWWFYMVFFLIFSFSNKNVTKNIYIIGIIATLSYLIYPFWFNRLLMYLMLWNIGASFANCYMQNIKIDFKSMLWPLLSISLALVLLVINFLINKDNIHTIMGYKGKFGIGVSPFIETRHFAVAILVTSAGIIWKNLNWIGFDYIIGPFERIAPVSYALYISHFFLITKATYLSFIGNEIIEFICYFIICIAFCYLVERMIYPRANKWIMKRVSPRKEVIV